MISRRIKLIVKVLTFIVIMLFVTIFYKRAIMISKIETKIVNKDWDFLTSGDDCEDIPKNLSLPIIAKQISGTTLSPYEKCLLIDFAQCISVHDLKQILLLGIHDSADNVIGHSVDLLISNNFDLNKDDISPEFLTKRIKTRSKEECSYAIADLILLLARVGNIEDINQLLFIPNNRGDDRDDIIESFFWAKAYLHEKNAVDTVSGYLSDYNEVKIQYALEWIPYLNNLNYLPYLKKLLLDTRSCTTPNELDRRLIADLVITTLLKIDSSFQKCTSIECKTVERYTIGEHIKVRKYYKLPIDDLVEAIPLDERHKYGL